MKVLRNALIAASACLFAASAVAQEGLVDEIRQPTLKALEGKKVVFVPMSMSFDLPEGWAAVMQKEAGQPRLPPRHSRCQLEHRYRHAGYYPGYHRKA
jgi:hypothetical protein